MKNNKLIALGKELLDLITGGGCGGGPGYDLRIDIPRHLLWTTPSNELSRYLKSIAKRRQAERLTDEQTRRKYYKDGHL